MKIIICIFIAYILGAIPSGYILGKLIKGIDVRKYGSKNIGATNTYRILGPIPGIITFVFDFLKGFLAVQIGRWILADNFLSSDTYTFELIIVVIGVVSVLGHIFPCFINFKGGKGIATCAGVFVNILPIPFLISLLVFISTLLVFRFVSLSSILSALTFFIVELIRNIPDFSELPYLLIIFFIIFIIIFKHRDNILRLLKGKESKIKLNLWKKAKKNNVWNNRDISNK